jgi:hypothetical protein
MSTAKACIVEIAAKNLATPAACFESQARLGPLEFMEFGAALVTRLSTEEMQKPSKPERRRARCFTRKLAQLLPAAAPQLACSVSSACPCMGLTWHVYAHRALSVHFWQQLASRLRLQAVLA